jgi:streptogramin lyase
MIIAERSRYVFFGLFVSLLTAVAASPARADLFVSSDSNNIVAQYDQSDGTFLSIFAQGQGLGSPRGVLVGPDGNLYVANSSGNNVLRFSGTDGTLIDVFASGGGLNGPRGIIFGPDGNLYVSSKNTSSILRYDGTTGQFIDVFVPAGSGGLNGPRGLVVGPDGNLYVASFGDVTSPMLAAVLRYNGMTGDFIDMFATDPASNTTNGINGLTFGPDGNLYVTKGGSDTIIRYDGTTGQQIDFFVQGNGTPHDPNGILFGPDGNLYVADLTSSGLSSVIRFDGTSGTLIDIFVAPDIVGNASYITFTKTDPSTLAYKP